MTYFLLTVLCFALWMLGCVLLAHREIRLRRAEREWSTYRAALVALADPFSSGSRFPEDGPATPSSWVRGGATFSHRWSGENAEQSHDDIAASLVVTPTRATARLLGKH